MSDLVITEKANLVSIADAIREKAGIEDGMSFPDGFLEAVEGISAGYPVAYGTFSLASATKDYVITHNLGVVPNVVFYWMQKNTTVTTSVIMSASHDKTIFPTTPNYAGGITTLYQNGTAQNSYRVLVPSVSGLLSTPSNQYPVYGGAAKATATTFKLCDSADGSGLTLAANVTYCWVAIGGLV